MSNEDFLVSDGEVEEVEGDFLYWGGENRGHCDWKEDASVGHLMSTSPRRLCLTAPISPSNWS